MSYFSVHVVDVVAVTLQAIAAILRSIGTSEISGDILQ